MKIHVIAKRLRHYNKWRRGDPRLRMPDPKQLGITVDNGAKALDKLYEFKVNMKDACKIADNAGLSSKQCIDFGYIIKIAQATIKTLIEDLENSGTNKKL